MRLLASLLTVLVIHCVSAQNNVLVTAEPGWIKKLTFDHDAVFDSSKVTNGEYYLLIDNQTHVELQHYYAHWAKMIVNKTGVQDGATITSDYDPEYQQLRFHKADIIRDGKVIRRLKESDILVLRREQNIDRSIYDGTLSAVIELEDIREGDIIECSYSIIGFNPIFGEEYFDFIQLQSSDPIHRLHHSILANATRPMALSQINTELEPTIFTAGGMNEYVVDLRRLKGLVYVNQAPSWYMQYPELQLNEFDSWKQVRSWALDVYRLPQSRSRNIRDQVEEIRSKYAHPEDQITAVLDFVQDEIRYLGFETGIHSHKPHAPDQVLRQRFGDCKDKTVLTVAMLELLDIAAYPALVNTYLLHTLPEQSPTPTSFDHCIVYLPLDDNPRWIDPTITRQGGKGGDRYIPDYGAALVVRPGGPVFEEIESPVNSSILVEEVFDVPDLEGPATMTVVCTYKGASAEAMRRMLSGSSIDEITQAFVEYYASDYGHVTPSEDLRVDDDRAANVLVTNEKYNLEEFFSVVDKTYEQRTEAQIIPRMVINRIYNVDNPMRSAPLYLGEKASIVEKITVNMPEPWGMDLDGMTFDKHGVRYASRFSSDGSVIKAEYEYKQDVTWVDSAAVADLYKGRSLIMDDVGFSLYREDPGSGGFSGGRVILGIIFLLCAAISVFLTLRTWRYDPASRATSEFTRPRPIGGWLILPAIGVVLTPPSLLYTTFFSDEVDFSQFAYTILPGSDLYNPALGTLVLTEFVINVFLIAFSILIAISFFRRRTSAPTMLICFYLIALIFVLSDFIVADEFGIIERQERPEFIREIIGNCISAAIWIPYLLLSEHVKNTFVFRLDGSIDDCQMHS